MLSRAAPQHAVEEPAAPPTHGQHHSPEERPPLDAVGQPPARPDESPMAHARRRLQGGPVSETCVRDAAEDLNQYGEKVGVNQLLGECHDPNPRADQPPIPSYLIEEISKQALPREEFGGAERLLPGPAERYYPTRAISQLRCCLFFAARMPADLRCESQRGPGLAGSINTVARRAHRAEHQLIHQGPAPISSRRASGRRRSCLRAPVGAYSVDFVAALVSASLCASQGGGYDFDSERRWHSSAGATYVV